MPVILAFIVLVILGGLFSYGIDVLEGDPIDAPPILPSNTYYFTKVIDGDTIEVHSDKSAHRVRLLGINTPEAYDYKERKKECWGEQASIAARQFFADAGTVQLIFDPQQPRIDAYDRFLAYVISNGSDFGEFMIETGNAFEYTYRGREYSKQQSYREHEKNARRNGRGMWSETAGCEY